MELRVAAVADNVAAEEDADVARGGGAVERPRAQRLEVEELARLRLRRRRERLVRLERLREDDLAGGHERGHGLERPGLQLPDPAPALDDGVRAGGVEGERRAGRERRLREDHVTGGDERA